MTNTTQTISFFGTVPANSNLTLVSHRITLPFRTKRIRASFAPGVQRLMKLYYFISQDSSAPTNEEPKGFNILSSLGQVNYITGDDEFKDLAHEVEYKESGAYIKIYAVNSDSYDHTIDSQVTIEYIEE